MNFIKTLQQKPTFLILSLLVLLVFSSCEKDSDLFAMAIEQDIAETIEDEEVKEEAEESEAVEEPTEEEPIPEDSPTDDFATELKAFPTAEGYGKYTTGGRGGRVIRVTTTSSRGSGSLHEALMTAGPRIIVFAVGGVFDIGNGFRPEGNLTIAGQTAPGDGVTITSSSEGYLEFYEGNVIVRNIRFRNGGGNGYSMFRFICNDNRDIRDVIFDHCSLSWADPSEMLIAFERELNNEQDNIAHDVTIQKSIFAEAGKSVLMYRGGYNFTFYQNYFYDPGFRTPMANYPYENPSLDVLTFENINTIIHNVTSAISIGLGSKISVVGSKMTLTNSTGYGADGFIRGESYGGCDGNCNTSGESYVYVRDNSIPSSISEVAGFDLPNYVFDSPYQALTIDESKILSVSSIDNILNDIGAEPRDNTDKTFVNYYLNRAGSIGKTWGNLENYSGGDSYQDNDGDGMDDAWERSRGLDPTVQDHNGDDDGDGYTNLEEFLNYLMP